MTDNNSAPPRQRRQSLVDIFSRPSLSTTNTAPLSTSASATPSSPSAPQRGSMSIALGLSNSTNPNSPYSAFARQRRASISTSSSGSPEFRNSFDDNAVIEEDDSQPMSRSAVGSPPSPSFGRRLSFGAQALRDVKSGAGGGAATNGGEGFNWSDAMRDKTQRAPSISSSNPFAGGHSRAKSFSTMAPAVQAEPPKEMPKPQVASPPPMRTKKPDHLGERMLRGDFMMD